ncbi:ferredoxin--NADP reductase [Mucilaginibacter sp. KACC 22063]|uniref:ferredoxin--NADP reductase n=1 Tax=Mucilaginibacter sp. KACC 22063 TaxID=3025666 RepID=UPI0023662F51|nr:ferredoxin--NADP reductase [Mucilaginibacter sp. KACC 22063]WDF54700.1 ferredoxin--NADP reductase [Mucilaginibacter sp. KACC 22063]
MLYYTLKVIEKREETNDTVSLVFKQPGLKKVKYEAGQYLTLIFRINGRRYIRPYSFSSAPGVDSNIEITVKRVPGGIVSNHIIDKVQVNDLIETMEPLGDFTFNNEYINNNSHVVLWGAGSGITPLISLAKYALHIKTVAHITLVYGNRSAESVIFNDTIHKLKALYPSTFLTWHFYTQLYVENENPYTIKGRIDAREVLAVIGKEKKLNQTFHYICGPIGLKESVKKALLEAGVDESKIFSEDFQIERNPADFNDIVTRNIVLEKSGQSHEIEVVKGKSILEAGLDASLELTYSCQTGTCKVCKARIKKGKVKMIGMKLKEEELQTYECLMCCSFPITEGVELAID